MSTDLQSLPEFLAQKETANGVKIAWGLFVWLGRLNQNRPIGDSQKWIIQTNGMSCREIGLFFFGSKRKFIY